jgi:uncharacterized protein (TIGR03067 family)
LSPIRDLPKAEAGRPTNSAGLKKSRSAHASYHGANERGPFNLLGEIPMTDQEKIQGTWQLVSGHRHGNVFPMEVTKNVRLIFAGDKLTTMNKDRGNDARFTLHPQLSPKGMDMDMQGHIGTGIYALEGDTLTIVHGEVGQSRPASFDGTAEPGLTMLKLQRSEA